MKIFFSYVIGILFMLYGVSVFFAQYYIDHDVNMNYTLILKGRQAQWQGVILCLLGLGYIIYSTFKFKKKKD